MHPMAMTQPLDGYGTAPTVSSLSTNPTLGHHVRGLPQKRLVGKRLSKKSPPAKEQFYYSNSIYSLNGGPIYKADHPSTAKSLSP
jgi:hypothetical protein